LARPTTRGQFEQLDDLMDASIIVPSYNSRATIARCLRSLVGQRSSARYEIIVVDSSNDGTGELIASQFPTVRLIQLPERTLPGRGRNLGIEAAQGAILAFTDADCVTEPQWLDQMIQAHHRDDYAAVGGAVLNGLPFNPVAWAGYLVEFSAQLPSFPRRFVDLLPTCNVSFRRTVFERHGLFPTDLWPSEDHIFSWRLAQAGERLLFDPSIHVRHIFRSQLTAFIRHQHRLGLASASARQQVPLPHAWLARHPVRVFTPVMRLAAIQARLARRDILNLLRFNVLLPICLPGLVAWGIGFWQGGGADAGTLRRTTSAGSAPSAAPPRPPDRAGARGRVDSNE
jgi:GT2 family glycosyltransferase